MNENHPIRFGVTMEGIPGNGGLKVRSGPPGNQNAFRHGLAAIEKRQDDGLLDRNIFGRYNIVNDEDLTEAQQRQQDYLATQRQEPTVKPITQAGK
jgi:hypothetical protein